MLFFLLFFFVKPVFAENSPDLYSQYRTDYLYQRDLYQKNYQDYQNKKSAHIQYGTVTAENDKNFAAKNVFLSQNSTLKAYLMALRVTLIGNQDTQDKIQKWEEWLSTQNQLIPNLNSSSAIKTWATTFQKQYVQIQSTYYTAIIQARIERRLNALESAKKLATLANIEWSSNFSDKESSIKENFQKAIEACQQNQRGDQFSDFYPEAKDYLDRADSVFSSLISDLKSSIIKSNH